LDTFYVGKLKGVGKVWQYTACSYAVAQVSTEFSAQAAARFLTARVLPVYRAAGWPLRRVLTDCGSEYRPSLCRLRNPAYPHPASSRLEGRLRRAPAGHHPHRAVAAGSSPTCGPCRPPWTGTWSSTTTAGPTRATEPGAARLPSCSGESRGGKIMIRRQTHEVYTTLPILDILDTGHRCPTGNCNKSQSRRPGWHREEPSTEDTDPWRHARPLGEYLAGGVGDVLF
jgi:hypothetical protein